MNVCFILNEYSLHNSVVGHYIAARPMDQVSLIKVKLVLKGKDRVRTASAVLPKLPKRFVAGKFVELLIVLMITVVPKILSRGAIFRRLSRIAARHRLPFHVTEHVSDSATLEFISAQSPDVIVTLVHQIIPRIIIKSARLGVVNIHPGLIPGVSGDPAVFLGVERGLWRVRGNAPLDRR
ncbi:MAG: hypothetical protein KDD69_07680 [Bdellovibrionales bacterium]|nr:hypothetical protein [Bdellovibrionales bacterium]